MDKLIIKGERPLNGTVKINGAKNSCLPILAATLLCGGRSHIHNCPALSDVTATVKILSHLGCSVTQGEYDVTVDASHGIACNIPEPLMSEMRSSIIFLGAMLARCGKAQLSLPGGCELGPRPIDMHLSALRQMGAVIEQQGDILNCRTKGRLCGTVINLSFPSVGATENIIIAASTAKGKTVILNAAREPEICDLASFLNRAGAKISGYGESTIIIEGVGELYGCNHTVIPDRIEAATVMAAAAVCGGSVNVKNIIPDHLQPLISVFKQAGCKLSVSENSLLIASEGKILPLKDIRTMPYPGFPTDAQAVIMAMSTIAHGTSIFIENIFESRYKHACELRRLGANIKTEGRMAVVEGVRRLNGTTVKATDLRGAACLVVAGTAAHGETTVTGLNHLDRGYYKLTERLNNIGANIQRRN